MSPTFQGRCSSSRWPGNADHNSGGIMGSIKVITILSIIVHKHTQNIVGHLGTWWVVSIVSKRRKESQLQTPFHVKPSTWLWN